MSRAANDPIGSRPARQTHAFQGLLREISYACVRGLWQISLRMEDADTGRSQYVTLSPGCGDAGELACGLQIAALQVGHQYYGSATLHRRGELHCYFAGRVTLAADKRRLHPLRLAAHHGQATSTDGGPA